jgi:LysR family glycine cleavage system transcriptional activator
LLASGPAIASPRDLAGYPLCHVDCVADGMVWPDWKMWLAVAGSPDVDASRSLAFPDSSHVARAALDGSAVGLLEPAMVEHELASGRLVRLFDIDVGMAPDFAYYLVYPQGSAEDARVRALRDWLRDAALPDAAGPRPGRDVAPPGSADAA